jgi:hypothetical protein
MEVAHDDAKLKSSRNEKVMNGSKAFLGLLA